MTYTSHRALHLLRTGSGNPNATFRDAQEDAIRHIVEGRSRLLVVQKTGWGKSFVYFIATKLLREAGSGPAKPCASGVMRVGVGWCARASTNNTIFLMSWWQRAPTWWRNGSRSPRPPG